MDWPQFYKARVNNPLYLDKFIGNYNPLLQYIRLNHHFGKAKRFIEEGVGIGTVPKALAALDPMFNPRMYLGKELCPRMRKLAESNNLPDWFGVIPGDITKSDVSYIGTDLVITHGVLEHFEDDTIISILNRYVLNNVNSVHYVPLIGHSAPSFGDERLLTYHHWLGLVHASIGMRQAYFNVKTTLYNESKDLVFSIECKTK